MTRTLNDVIADLPCAQQREIEMRAAYLIEEELTLRDVREARELAQIHLGEALQTSRDGMISEPVPADTNTKGRAAK